jgi:hypothetical protein
VAVVGRLPKIIKWVLVAVACIFVLGLGLLLVLPRPAELPPVIERLLAAGPGTTAFSAILPDRDWDTVCYIDPYDKASLDLPRHLGKGLSGYSYQPSDLWFSETESGLAFIDHGTKTIYLFTIKKGRELPGIWRIRGPRCLPKDSASFSIELVDGLNFDTHQLFFVATD